MGTNMASKLLEDRRILLRWLDEHLISNLIPQGQQLQDSLLPGAGTHGRPWSPALVALDAVRFRRSEVVLCKIREHSIVLTLSSRGLYCTASFRCLS